MRCRSVLLFLVFAFLIAQVISTTVRQKQDEIYRNNLKNRFLTASDFPQNLDSPRQKTDSSSCFGINEKRDLDCFLRELIFHHHFGYTLFGDKPVSIAAYFVQEPFENVLYSGRNRSHLRELWCVWEKYQKKIEIRDYLFLNEPDVNIDGIQVISLINKKAFVEKVNEHIELFRSVLGNCFTPEFLLDELTKSNSSLFKLLDYNEGLYGILLGFGKNNAFGFKRRLELARFVDPMYRDFPSRFSFYFPKLSNEFASFSEEYSSLQETLRPIPGKQDLSPIAFPSMVAYKNDEETVLLEKKYHEERQKIIKTYSKGDFLDTTLKQLCK